MSRQLWSLVAGGAGFVGSHLCERLLDAGQPVVCLDDLSTGSLNNLEHLVSREDFLFIEHDVVDTLPAMPDLARVYHLASPASPPAYASRPVQTLRANSEGTLHLLELALRNNARFLYASTSEVYGDPLEHPQREEHRGNVSPIGPRSMYDEAKRYGEALTMAYIRSHGLDGRIVRLFNTYGPNSSPDDGRMIPNFICQALTNKPITIYGDGRQTRSICFVLDTVEGLVRAMEVDEARGEVINIGNPEEHCVLDFAQRIASLAGSSAELVFMEPAVADDPRQRRPDISKARLVLNWEPQVAMSEGLGRTVAYFRSLVEVAVPVAGIES